MKMELSTYVNIEIQNLVLVNQDSPCIFPDRQVTTSDTIKAILP